MQLETEVTIEKVYLFMVIFTMTLSMLQGWSLPSTLKRGAAGYIGVFIASVILGIIWPLCIAPIMSFASMRREGVL